MSSQKHTVVIISNGLNDEKASVGWSLAVGALNADMKLTVFLVSNGVDWGRKGAADNAHLNPLDPSMKDMMQIVIDAGATIMACPPCCKMRGYEESSMIDEVVFAGSAAMYEHVVNGAQVISL